MSRTSNSWAAVLRSYPDSKRINSVSLQAEALYLRLLMVADTAGRFHGHAFDVGAKVCTARLRSGELTEEGVETLLQDLESAGLIGRGEVNGELLLEICDHRDQRRSKPRFPAIPGVSKGQEVESVTREGRVVTAEGKRVPGEGRSVPQLPEKRGEESRREERRGCVPSARPVWFPEDRWGLCCSQVAASLSPTSTTVLKAVAQAARTGLVEWGLAKEVAELSEAQSEPTRQRFLEWIDRGDTAADVGKRLDRVLIKVAGEKRPSQKRFIASVLSNWRKDLGHAS